MSIETGTIMPTTDDRGPRTSHLPTPRRYRSALCALCDDGFGRGKGLACAKCPPRKENTGAHEGSFF